MSDATTPSPEATSKLEEVAGWLGGCIWNGQLMHQGRRYKKRMPTIVTESSAIDAAAIKSVEAGVAGVGPIRKATRDWLKANRKRALRLTVLPTVRRSAALKWALRED